MKAALINDLSGLGRCSLVADIAVLSAMGVTACPMPTAVLSAQTAYPAFSRLDMTDGLPVYVDKWRAVGARFDGILTGYMTGEEQAAIIKNFVSESLEENCRPEAAGQHAPFVLVDPVMGDDGRAYSNFTDGLCRQLKNLAAMADIITPNLTELWLLTDGPLTELRSAAPEASEITRRARQLLTGRCQTVAVTGIRRGEEIGSLIVTPGAKPHLFLAPRCPQSFCGTGDVFAAIVFGGLLRGDAPDTVFELAASFISEAAMSARQNGATANDGIDYEKGLGKLIKA
ncbi:MAG: bifunctional hydroxymethylpyrimidine kinase/phosphomethylpyrimidine kinase [Lachnospiraceae bacterium]|jgi:pyridoxine kinase|nr:bifunctional hydroxymethylpyrimidine kinase/phosphomethylpyrimidine kinase [Lachnospiraceae bacterium]MCH4031443.1 bifunctional hydroxymethylpyrimidine kinase/phosphomethylpyrimidine kinase [Lachnospiraceae bacterium]MCH4071010.1 bifunctional hydroxymethylpyrimidine kinase/phosphomethylpyrimidine kinase [Lachnospiraceae bacterium]MCH4107997.1 bifunctional hydroxymethylpyrimidine kinase/phosphomethylpyrimidine kinase [Lachnospiraceae bacterium]MCI1302465.1 bifunctional hydroxymethylpyrimidine